MLPPPNTYLSKTISPFHTLSITLKITLLVRSIPYFVIWNSGTLLVSAMIEGMTLDKTWPCWTWFALECSARIMWGKLTKMSPNEEKPSALAFLHQYRAVQQSGKVDPVPNRAASQPVTLDPEPKQMPPKTMLLLISQCFHISNCFRFLSGLNFIVVRDLYNFWQYLQFSHSLTNKCEQKNIQSEKPLVHDEISTSIIRFVSEDWNLFYNHYHSKEWLQISNYKSNENLFFIYYSTPISKR